MPRGRAANGSGLQPRLRKDGRWEVRYSAGIDGRTGKPRIKSLYGTTSEEVARKLREVTASVDAGTFIEPKRMTLAVWLDRWLSDYTAGNKPGTLNDYKGHCDNHIKPALGAVRLCELQPHDIQAFANRLAKQPSPKTGKPLSAKTVRNIIQGTLSKALSEAVRIRYIPMNPAAGCILPKAGRREIQPLEGEQIAQFMQAIRGNPSEDLFFVAINTGMRLSELLGLRWSRVDWKAQTIKVDAQLMVKRGTGSDRALGTTKNGKPRTFKAAPAVMETLAKVRKEQLAHKVKAGQTWNNPLDLVFTDESGASIPHATVEHRLSRIMQGMGLNRRFHDLRHTFATECLRIGVPAKTVSEYLGHSSVAFTLDQYTHVTGIMMDDASNRIQAVISERMRNG